MHSNLTAIVLTYYTRALTCITFRKDTNLSIAGNITHNYCSKMGKFTSQNMRIKCYVVKSKQLNMYCKFWASFDEAT